MEINKIYEIVISKSANNKMYEHFDFLARVSEEAAKCLLKELLNDIKSPKVMPHRNPTYENSYLKIGEYRYMLSAKRYRIIYKIKDNKVFVDDIQDCRQMF